MSYTASAQVDIQTLGGGRLSPAGSDAGFVDGNALQVSQFNAPLGLAVDLAGQLFVADSKNGAIRQLDVGGNRSTTILTGLNQPVDIAVTPKRDLFIVTQGDGRLRRMDRFGNVDLLPVQLNGPTAIGAASNGDLFITQTSGTLVMVDSETDELSVVSAGLIAPRGVAVLDSGVVAVSESGRNRILLIDPSDGSIVSQIGAGIAGFRDGSVANAQFNAPHHLAKGPDGSLIVADRGNHRIRWIQADGTVTTIYGKSPAAWEGPECLTCDPIILPGWLDGSATFAEGREPAGVAVAADGTVYTSELHYHLIRTVTGLTFADPGGGGSGPGELPVLPPVISPDHGYFPMGQQITVTNPNTNAFFSTAIYYTTDGTDPTTNSFRVPLTNHTGSIFWRDSLRDLRALRLVAYVGSRASEVVSGRPAPRNEIGITREITAGIGSTVIVPVVVNLRPETELKSLQFLVQVSPSNPATPPIPETLRLLPVSTNDLVPVVTSSEDGDPARFAAMPYELGTARGFAVTFIGTNANLTVRDFAVISMLAVPIPANAAIGDRYSIQVLQPSGTSDGIEQGVAIEPMPARAIVAGEVSYLVGDSSPATWYNADRPGFGFGDGSLNNNDVNNVFAASLGQRNTYPFTDLFDAMDAYPVDTAESAGGDGLIRFLDWQIVLLRSLNLDPARWARKWASTGERVPIALASASGGAANRAADVVGSSSGSVWQRNALLSAASIENARPGATIEIPVHAIVSAGSRVSGLAFRAAMVSETGGPAVQEPLYFATGAGEPAPIQTTPSADVLLCGWPAVPQSAFSPAIEGSRRLGTIRVRVPLGARRGDIYRLIISHADGAPDLRTQYAFETHSAAIWVESNSSVPEAQLISDDWKRHFFGSERAEMARGDADPDDDGMPNWAEYHAGTDPMRGDSALGFKTAVVDRDSKQLALRWQSAPGKVYSIQAATDLQEADWKTVAAGLNGDGSLLQWTSGNPAAVQQFYRLTIETPGVPPASINLSGFQEMISTQ